MSAPLPARAFAIAAVLVATILTTTTAAHARTLPALDRRVVDEAGALEPGARAQLESTLAAYQQRTGHQLAVVILRSLEGDALEALSMRAAEQWRLGDAQRDDGMLLLLAMQERAVRIEVGYGLEGVVTDALASRVIREQMAPRFAQGDVAGGLSAGTDVLMRAAEGENVGAAPSAGSTARETAAGWADFAPLVLFVVVFVLAGILRRRGGGGGGGGLSSLWLLTSLLGGAGRGGRAGGGGAGGGFRGGGFRGGGGGFGGGGGGFGGGGASGRW